MTDTMIPGIIPSGHNDSKGSFKNGGLKVRLKGRSGKTDAFPTKTERKSVVQRKKWVVNENDNSENGAF